MIPADEFEKKVRTLDKSKHYLLVCQFGVRSEDLAYELKKKKIKSVGISVEQFLNIKQ